MDGNTEFENSYTDYQGQAPDDQFHPFWKCQMLFYEIQTVYHEFNSRNCSLDGHTQYIVSHITNRSDLIAWPASLGNSQAFKDLWISRGIKGSTR